MIWSIGFLFFSQLLQPSHCTLSSQSSRSIQFPCSSCNLLLTCLTFPYSNDSPLDTRLPTEWTIISGSLWYFKLLGYLSKRWTISSSILSSDSYFLSSLRHLISINKYLLDLIILININIIDIKCRRKKWFRHLEGRRHQWLLLLSNQEKEWSESMEFLLKSYNLNY